MKSLNNINKFLKINTESDDQVVPTISSAVPNVQRHLQIMHNIMADSSLATAVTEENTNQSPSSLHSTPDIAAINTTADSTSSSLLD